MRPKPRRESVHRDLHDAAEGVAVAARRLDLLDHRGAGARVECPNRVGIEGALVVGFQDHADIGAHRADLDDVADQRRPRGSARGTPGQRRPTPPGLLSPGQTPARPPCVGEAVLLHAGQVGVPRTGRVSGAFRACSSSSPASTGSTAMTVSHFGHLAVADPDRDRSALGQSVAHPAEDLHVVLLELHPGTTPMPEPPAPQRLRNVRGGDLDARGQAFEDRDQRRPCDFAVSQRNMSGSMRPRPRRRRAPRSARPPTCTGRTGSRSCVRPGRRR